jgi:hypothetical protein
VKQTDERTHRLERARARTTLLVRAVMYDEPPARQAVQLKGKVESSPFTANDAGLKEGSGGYPPPFAAAPGAVVAIGKNSEVG